MSVIRVSQIHLVRSKKLKGGGTAVRNLRTIYNPKTTISETGGITVDIDHRWVEGQLVGQTDMAKGTISIKEDIPLVLKGYLKYRGFKLVGYNLDATLTNTNRKVRKS